MQAYKNMSLTKKLILSMMVIAIIGIAIGLVGISGMSSLSEEDEEMYLYNALPMQYLAAMYDTLASQRICANNMVIFREADPQFAQEEADALSEKEQLFDEAFASYSQTLSDADEETLYNNMNKLYYGDFVTVKANVRAAVASGEAQAMADAIQAMDSMGSDISGYMDEAFSLNGNLAADKVQANKDLYRNNSFLLIGVMIVGAACAVLFAVYLARIISRPIKRIEGATKQVAETGSLEFNEETIAAIQEDGQAKDEIGMVAKSFAEMMDSLIAKTKVLETVADGDLTPTVPLASEKDTIGNATVKMLNSLNQMFAQLNQISAQVAASAGEIANGSQSLAQGASEQAATVQQISAAISEITGQSSTSVETAREASSDGNAIRNIALEGNQKMENMMNAVLEINEASKAIEKVIKAIDDIAFQTNILALNAAVEAARAGQHGKGFAVVADEVRNLAAKSADAAKETSALISSNIEKAELGLSISNDTAQSLQQIMDGIQKTTSSLLEMTQQSETIQSATSQVSIAVDQVAQVVQQNSATSEQSAAASQEMSSQAQMLREMVSRYRLRNDAGSTAPYRSMAPSDSFALNR